MTIQDDKEFERKIHQEIEQKRKLPKVELLSLKKQIFLSHLSVEMKQEQIKGMNEFIANQEMELEE